MYFYSKKSQRKIIHTMQCPYCIRMNREGMATFHTMEVAREKNYRLCQYCAPMGKYYRAEYREIKKYADENGMIFSYYDGTITVCTPYSQWKIIVNGRKRDMFLYHKNVYKNSFEKSLVPGYHSQSVRRNSILAYMNYIVKHDRYRLSNPSYQKPLTTGETKQGKKKYKRLVEKRKKQERYDSIMRVLALIENGTEYRQMKV